jgi:hypothetical protein
MTVHFVVRLKGSSDDDRDNRGTPQQRRVDSRGARLLGSGVPLSLVLDLASDRPSEEIYDSEPGSADWLEAPSR